MPRLRRRFRCTVREAAGLGELFLALDAGPDVVSHYEAEARRRPVAAIVEDLVHLVARLALAEEVGAEDALERAQCLGDWAEGVTEDGQGAQLAEQSDAEAALLAWHAVGSVQPERIACPVCRAAYEADDEAAEIPSCPACGARETWESRQGPAFRALVDEIDGCASLGELGLIGKWLYGLDMSHEQARVAWSHYQLRRAALEAAVGLGVAARALIAEVERASERELPHVGKRLYRLQHAGAAASRRPSGGGSGRPTRRDGAPARHRDGPSAAVRLRGAAATPTVGGGAFAMHAPPHDSAPVTRGGAPLALAAAGGVHSAGTPWPRWPAPVDRSQGGGHAGGPCMLTHGATLARGGQPPPIAFATRATALVR